MSEDIICITCPLGCRMRVQVEGEEVKEVQGNRCKKGLKFAEREVFFPGRTLTTTVRTDIPGIALLPVRSASEIPKDRLMDCMGEISGHRVSGSIQCGQPVIQNILGLGVDIVACRSLP